jgi:hypothetical protein
MKVPILVGQMMQGYMINFIKRKDAIMPIRERGERI